MRHIIFSKSPKELDAYISGRISTLIDDIQEPLINVRQLEGLCLRPTLMLVVGRNAHWLLYPMATKPRSVGNAVLK